MSLFEQSFGFGNACRGGCDFRRRFYDNEGHLRGAFDDTNDKYYVFFYDTRGRMTRVNRHNGVNESAPIDHQTIYTYDALNRRIARSVAGLVEEYVYDGDNLYLEFAGTGTAPSHRYQYADSVDSILADENLTVANGVVDWYLTDHEGSVRSVVRGSDGALKNSLTYTAFGQLTESVPAFDQQFSYTGREFDEATGPNGLYYYRARFYDAKLGRFLQQDPSAFAGGDVNLYRYVGNNPVRQTDPYGLAAQMALGKSGQDYFRSQLISGSFGVSDVERIAWSAITPGLLIGAPRSDGWDQAVSMSTESQAAALLRHMDAAPKAKLDLTTYADKHGIHPQTPLAAVHHSAATEGFDEALDSAKSVDDKLAVMKDFRSRHEAHLRVEARRSQNANFLIKGLDAVDRLFTVELGYDKTTLYADGSDDVTIGAEPDTQDMGAALIANYVTLTRGRAVIGAARTAVMRDGAVLTRAATAIERGLTTARRSEGVLGTIAKGATKVQRFFWDSRPFDTIRKQYWAARGGAGTRELHHWQFPRRLTSIAEGWRNAGINLIELPAFKGVFHRTLSLNKWMGFAPNWHKPAVAFKAEVTERAIRYGLYAAATAVGTSAYKATQWTMDLFDDNEDEGP